MNARKLLYFYGLKYEEVDLSNCVIVKAEEDNFQLKFSHEGLRYSYNGKTWNRLSANQYTKTLSKNSIIYLRGNLTPNSYSGIGTFSSTKKFSVSGNCMALIFNTTASEAKSLEGYKHAFYNLFKNSRIVSVSENFLPATTLSESCYYNMFFGCTSLKFTPRLPAVKLANGCYKYMFNGCSSLQQLTYDLPNKIESAEECFMGMFGNCFNLIKAPTLDCGKTAKKNMYNSMFTGCTKLVDSPTLNITTFEYGCCRFMFSGCVSLKNCNFSIAGVLNSYCCYGMFYGCTSLVNMPIISFDYISEGSFELMFSKCTSLIDCYDLPSVNLNSFRSMFKDCTSLIKAPVLRSTILKSETYGSMFEGCTNLNEIKAAFIDEPSEDYMKSWVANVAPTGTFYVNKNIKWDYNDPKYENVSGIPIGWVVRRYDFSTDKPVSEYTVSITSNYSNYGWTSGKGTYDEGATVKISAGSYGNYEFKHWKEGDTTINANPYTFVIDRNRSFEAIFAPLKYSLEVTCDTSKGVVSLGVGSETQGLYDYNTYATVKAQSSNESRFQFVGWYDTDGNLVSDKSQFNFKVTKDTVLEAKFKTIYTVTVTLQDSNSGTVTGGGKYLEGSDFTIEYIPAIGYTFKRIGSPNGFGSRVNPITIENISQDWEFTVTTEYLGSNYLTIETLEDNTDIYWYDSSSQNEICYYSLDAVSWTTMPQQSNYGYKLFVANKNTKVFFKSQFVGQFFIVKKGTASTYAQCNLYGNCLSMGYMDEASSTTNVTKSYKVMFMNNNIKIVDKNFLPAKTISVDYAYQEMFRDCKLLTQAPELPADVLTKGCYQGMFKGCSSLKNPPTTLPATQLKDSCYDSMFYGCAGLKICPEMKAEELAVKCYYSMFYSSGITKAPIIKGLPTKTQCYCGMFNGCIHLNQLEVDFDADFLENLNIYDFGGWLYYVGYGGTITVPYGLSFSASTYQNSEVWETYATDADGNNIRVDENPGNSLIPGSWIIKEANPVIGGGGGNVS